VFFSDRLQVQQNITATNYNSHKIRVLLSPKPHFFSPKGICVLVKEKTHGFSFWTATLVLPRLPKKTCARFKKNTWLFGGLNSCVFMLENTRVLFLHKTHKTHKCGVDKPLINGRLLLI